MFEDDVKVRQEIRKLRKRAKKSPLLFARLGECYLSLGDWDKAKKVLESGVEAHPYYTTGLRILGEGYLLNGLNSDAEECAAKGLEQDPNHLGLLQLMEKVKKRQEENEEATQIRDRLNTLDPLLYVDQQETEEAVENEAPAEIQPESEQPVEEAPEDDFVEDIKKATRPKAAKKTEPESEITEEKATASETSESEEILAEDDEEASEINKMIEEMKSAGVSETEDSAEPLSEAKDATTEEVTDTKEEVPKAAEKKADAQSKATKADDKTEDQAKDKDTPQQVEEPAQEAQPDSDPFGLDEEAESVEPKEAESKGKPAPKAKTEAKKKPELAEEEVVEEKEANADKVTSKVSEEPESAEAAPEPEKAEEKPKGKKKKIATKTLGELYATQQKFDEAIEIYEKLLENDPDNKEFKDRLDDLKNRREEALSESTE